MCIRNRDINAFFTPKIVNCHPLAITIKKFLDEKKKKQ